MGEDAAQSVGGASASGGSGFFYVRDDGCLFRQGLRLALWRDQRAGLRCVVRLHQVAASQKAAGDLDLEPLRIAATDVLDHICRFFLTDAERLQGLGGEIAAQINERAFDWLDAPVERLGSMEVPMPYNDKLERAVIPNQNAIADAVRRVCYR